MSFVSWRKFSKPFLFLTRLTCAHTVSPLSPWHGWRTSPSICHESHMTVCDFQFYIMLSPAIRSLLSLLILSEFFLTGFTFDFDVSHPTWAISGSPPDSAKTIGDLHRGCTRSPNFSSWISLTECEFRTEQRYILTSVSSANASCVYHSIASAVPVGLSFS